MSTDPRSIKIEDYNYDLPDGRIAYEPVEPRDESKLLCWDNGSISHHRFKDITDLLSPEDTLVFNNAKVINARLYFQKETGGIVEIFVLEPFDSTPEKALNDLGKTTWKCFVGGAKKWKQGDLKWKGEHLGIQDFSARLISRSPEFLIEFSWEPAVMPWGTILEMAGNLPLPPYIEREARPEDQQSYQTVYARNPGSVAAPTAGLHFSDEVLDTLQKNGVGRQELTLHVGAGTFKPVSAENLKGHDMHHELVSVTYNQLRALRLKDSIVSVGTTALRSLESLYWLACRIKSDTDASRVMQWDGWEIEPVDDRNTALDILLNHMESREEKELNFFTGLMIAPGYQVRMADALITNFHMPKSTLLVLISALVGDNWKDIYQTAMENGYRFLSYGDSSLIRYK